MQSTSPRFYLDKAHFIHILKVLGYSCAAAVCAAIVAIVGHANIPEQYMALVPIMNTGIVALERWFTDHSQQ